MRPRSALSLATAVMLAACSPGADALAPRDAANAAPPSRLLTTGGIQNWSTIVHPFRRELLEASAGLLYTSESDYPFDYVSRAVFLRDTLTLDSFRVAFLVPRTTPVDVRTLDRFFAPHIERVDPNDPASVALVPRYENLKFQLQELLNAPKVYCVGTIQLRCYAVGTSPEGVVAGLATTAIET